MRLSKNKAVNLSVILVFTLISNVATATDLDIHREGGAYATLISDSAGTSAEYTWAASRGRVLNSVTIANYTGHLCNNSDSGQNVRLSNVASTPYAPSLFGFGEACCPMAGSAD